MTDTSKRELIEEAAKAMYFEDCGFAALDDDAESFRDMARVAFAVFEQAHTPSDDASEREEIARIIDGHIEVPVSSRLAIARSLQGNGFRRTAVQEPQIECPHWSPGRITIRKGCTACAAESEPQGEPTDAPTVQLAARRGGKVQAMIDSMLAQANERGIHVEVVYPQDGPTDAQPKRG